jgi:hypothetical protein
MASGWGHGAWGVTPWGGSAPLVPSYPSPPTITPLDPIAFETGVAQSQTINVRIIDDRGVDITKVAIAVDGVYYFIGGSAYAGATVTYTANGGNGYDVEIALPYAMVLGSTVGVYVTAIDIDNNLATKFYSFIVGIGLRLLAARNPRENILVAQFNRALLQDAEFYFVSNWVVTAITEGADDIEILEVMGNTSQPGCAYLRYSGGSSATYLLTVRNVKDRDGAGIETGYDHAEFELAYPDEDIPTTYLFDTLIGPIGITQGLINRRTIDAHVVNRCMALGMQKQYELKVQTVDASYVSGTTRPGARRV